MLRDKKINETSLAVRREKQTNKKATTQSHNVLFLTATEPFFFLTEALSETKGGRTAEGEVTKTKPNKKRKIQFESDKPLHL